ncbi:MAG: methyltransferase [Bacteroidales bacterium]|jgi:tRNA1Val (adenine37-N6)-methyltransferase|nr:methyltransferase [Bacteroidales bacterium]
MSYFKFKKFIIHQDKCAMKVGTDGVLLGAWCKPKDNSEILDIGTGTGLIALMIAQQCNSKIEALEIDKSAFNQAKENVKRSSWSERINVINISFQDFCKSCNIQYNFIVTNPPYFSNSLLTSDDKRTMARHDISLSHKDIIDGVVSLLKQEGSFNIILPYVEGNIFIAEAALKALFCVRKTNVLPVPNRKPKRLLLEFSKNKMPLMEDSIVIENFKRHNYSDAYKNLTKEFYLFF